jgi:hypothetical protein
MKRFLPIALCVSMLAAPALAGDVNMPGKTDPPPCSANCSSSSTPLLPESENLLDSIKETLLLLGLKRI